MMSVMSHFQQRVNPDLLCTFHIELSLARCVGRMKGDEFDPHQIVTGRDA